MSRMPMEPSALQNGTIVDRYTVDSLIGEGGMAVVFRVRHNQLGTWHALKVLTLSSRQIRERLKQEGRFQARLQHPNVVAVTDVIDIGGSDGLIMEYVDGPSLDALMHQQRLTLPQVDELASGILAGVAEAHRLGFVHRDLKPANVLLKVTPRGYVPKVADFGLAKSFGEGSDPGKARTRTGSTMGTPHYMSPEQVRDAKNVGPRSDIFALGAMLYEMVSGRRAFEGADLLEIFNAVANGQCTPLRELVPDILPRMELAIEAAMKTDPRERPESVEALAILWRGSNSPTLLSLSSPGFERPGSAFEMPFRASEVPFRGPRGSDTWAAAETLPDDPPTTDSVGRFSDSAVPTLGPIHREVGPVPERAGPTLAPATMHRSRFAWALGGGLVAAVLVGLLLVGSGAAAAWYWMSPEEGAGGAVAIRDPGPPDRPAPVIAPDGTFGSAPVGAETDPQPSETPVESPFEGGDVPAPRSEPAKAPGDPEKVDPAPSDGGIELIGMQASDDPRERQRAVANLGKRADDEAIRILDRFVRTDTDANVRREAWSVVVERYLKRFGDVGLLETTVVWQMGHGNARDASEAVEAFGRFGTEPGLLIGAIRHDNREVRLAVTAVLPKIAGRADDGVDYDGLMAPLLGDPDPVVLKKARQALAQVE